MEKICVIGLSCTGVAIVKALRDAELPVSVIDNREGRIKSMDDAENCMTLRRLDKKALEELGIAGCSHVVICFEDQFLLSEEVTMAVSELEVPCVIAIAQNDSRSELLRMIGADQIVVVGHAVWARSLAATVAFPSMTSFKEVDDRHGVGELLLAKNVEFDARAIEAEYSVRWIGLRRSGDTLGDVLHVSEGERDASSVSASAGDRVVFLGEASVLAALSSEYFS
jgi:Trk K+ transport system NAD-binding subunit